MRVGPIPQDFGVSNPIRPTRTPGPSGWASIPGQTKVYAGYGGSGPGEKKTKSFF